MARGSGDDSAGSEVPHRCGPLLNAFTRQRRVIRTAVCYSEALLGSGKGVLGRKQFLDLSFFRFLILYLTLMLTRAVRY